MAFLKPVFKNNKVHGGMLPDILINFRENLQVSLQCLNLIPVFGKYLWKNFVSVTVKMHSSTYITLHYGSIFCNVYEKLRVPLSYPDASL